MKLLTSAVRKLTAWAWQHEIGVVDGIAKLKKLNMDENGMRLELEQHPEAAKWVALCFAELVAAAPNYVELRFNPSPVQRKDRWEWVTVLVTKGSGKTPHQLRREAEAERDALKPDAEKWRACMSELKVHPKTP